MSDGPPPPCHKKVSILKEKIIEVSELIKSCKEQRTKCTELQEKENKLIRNIKIISTHYIKSAAEKDAFELDLHGARKELADVKRQLHHSELQKEQLEQLITVYQIERSEYGIEKVDFERARIRKLFKVFMQYRELVKKAGPEPKWQIEILNRQFKSELKEWNKVSENVIKPLTSPALSYSSYATSSESGFESMANSPAPSEDLQHTEHSLNLPTHQEMFKKPQKSLKDATDEISLFKNYQQKENKSSSVVFDSNTETKNACDNDDGFIDEENGPEFSSPTHEEVSYEPLSDLCKKPNPQNKPQENKTLEATQNKRQSIFSDDESSSDLDKLAVSPDKVKNDFSCFENTVSQPNKKNEKAGLKQLSLTSLLVEQTTNEQNFDDPLDCENDKSEKSNQESIPSQDTAVNCDNFSDSCQLSNKVSKPLSDSAADFNIAGRKLVSYENEYVSDNISANISNIPKSVETCSRHAFKKKENTLWTEVNIKSQNFESNMLQVRNDTNVSKKSPNTGVNILPDVTQPTDNDKALTGLVLNPKHLSTVDDMAKEAVSIEDETTENQDFVAISQKPVTQKNLSFLSEENSFSNTMSSEDLISTPTKESVPQKNNESIVEKHQCEKENNSVIKNSQFFGEDSSSDSLSSESILKSKGQETIVKSVTEINHLPFVRRDGPDYFNGSNNPQEQPKLIKKDFNNGFNALIANSWSSVVEPHLATPNFSENSVISPCEKDANSYQTYEQSKIQLECVKNTAIQTNEIIKDKRLQQQSEIITIVRQKPAYRVSGHLSNEDEDSIPDHVTSEIFKEFLSNPLVLSPLREPLENNIGAIRISENNKEKFEILSNYYKSVIKKNSKKEKICESVRSVNGSRILTEIEQINDDELCKHKNNIKETSTSDNAKKVDGNHGLNTSKKEVLVNVNSPSMSSVEVRASSENLEPVMPQHKTGKKNFRSRGMESAEDNCFLESPDRGVSKKEARKLRKSKASFEIQQNYENVNDLMNETRERTEIHLVEFNKHIVAKTPVKRSSDKSKDIVDGEPVNGSLEEKSEKIEKNTRHKINELKANPTAVFQIEPNKISLENVGENHFLPIKAGNILKTRFTAVDDNRILETPQSIRNSNKFVTTPTTVTEIKPNDGNSDNIKELSAFLVKHIEMSEKNTQVLLNSIKKLVKNKISLKNKHFSRVIKTCKKNTKKIQRGLWVVDNVPVENIRKTKKNSKPVFKIKKKKRNCQRKFEKCSEEIDTHQTPIENESLPASDSDSELDPVLEGSKEQKICLNSEKSSEKLASPLVPEINFFFSHVQSVSKIQPTLEVSEKKKILVELETKNKVLSSVVKNTTEISKRACLKGEKQDLNNGRNISYFSEKSISPERPRKSCPTINNNSFEQKLKPLNREKTSNYSPLYSFNESITVLPAHDKPERNHSFNLESCSKVPSNRPISPLIGFIQNENYSKTNLEPSCTKIVTNAKYSIDSSPAKVSKYAKQRNTNKNLHSPYKTERDSPSSPPRRSSEVVFPHCNSNPGISNKRRMTVESNSTEEEIFENTETAFVPYSPPRRSSLETSVLDFPKEDNGFVKEPEKRNTDLNYIIRDVVPMTTRSRSKIALENSPTSPVFPGGKKRETELVPEKIVVISPLQTKNLDSAIREKKIKTPDSENYSTDILERTNFARPTRIMQVRNGSKREKKKHKTDTSTREFIDTENSSSDDEVEEAEDFDLRKGFPGWDSSEIIINNNLYEKHLRCNSPEIFVQNKKHSSQTPAKEINGELPFPLLQTFGKSLNKSNIESVVSLSTGSRIKNTSQRESKLRLSPELKNSSQDNLKIVVPEKLTVPSQKKENQFLSENCDVSDMWDRMKFMKMKRPAGPMPSSLNQGNKSWSHDYQNPSQSTRPTPSWPNEVNRSISYDCQNPKQSTMPTPSWLNQGNKRLSTDYQYSSQPDRQTPSLLNKGYPSFCNDSQNPKPTPTWLNNGNTRLSNDFQKPTHPAYVFPNVSIKTETKDFYNAPNYSVFSENRPKSPPCLFTNNVNSHFKIHDFNRVNDLKVTGNIGKCLPNNTHTITTSEINYNPKNDLGLTQTRKRKCTGLLDDIIGSMEKPPVLVKTVAEAVDPSLEKKRQRVRNKRKKKKKGPTLDDVPKRNLSNKECEMATNALDLFLTAKIESSEDAQERMNTCITSLCSANDATIVKAIALVVAENVNEELDLRFTPPAPPLTATQHRLFALFKANKRLEGLFTQMLTSIRNMILPDRFGWADDTLESCSRFYGAVCRQLDEPSVALKLCVDVAVEMKQRGSIVINAILSAWPEILPLAEGANIFGPGSTMALLVMLTPLPKRTLQMKSLETLKLLLQKYYGYSCEVNRDEWSQKAMKAIREGDTAAGLAFNKVSHCLGFKWSSTAVVAPILESLGVWEFGGLPDSTARIMVNLLVSALATCQPNENRLNNIKIEAVQRIGDILLSGKLSSIGEEIIVEEFLRLNPKNQFLSIIKKWVPRGAVNESIQDLIQRAMKNSGSDQQTKNYRSKNNQNKKKRKAQIQFNH